MVSSYVKSFGFFLKRSTNFSFDPIILLFMAAKVLTLVLISKYFSIFF